jgi:uncharacterized protein involved in outer membrane biogenesis
VAILKKVRKILWLVAGLVVVVPIVVVLVALLQIDRIVKTGVELGGKAALGVDTQLGSASVSLFGGSVEFKDLSVANPAGFTSPTFVKAGLIRADISPADLLKNELYVQEITLEGPEFTYELKDGQSNFGVLMDRLKGEEKPPEEEKKKKEEREPIKLKVDLVRITGVKVHVVIEGQQIEAVSIDKIEMRNLADSNGNAVPADQLVRAVVANVRGIIEIRLSGLIREGRAKVEEKLGEEMGAAREKFEKEADRAQEKWKKLLNR